MRAFSVAVAVGLVPVLLWRRVRPLPVVLVAFGITAVAALATGGEAPQLNSMAYLLILPYALFRWGTGREAVVGGAVVVTSAAVSMLTAPPTLGDAIGGFAVLFTSIALGVALRYRAGVRLRELDQVKLLERERLARDLHDTVAHHVSAIVIRAQAGLATAPTRPEAATEALRVIEVEAARTLAEMRSMVHVLRRNQDRDEREPADLAPTPKVADLVELANRTSIGPAVDVEIVGAVADLAPPVAAA
nr:histidine kinase dimerization/phosphoacceptor domain-containing protein [Micromonospora sp. DSM 115978]